MQDYIYIYIWNADDDDYDDAEDVDDDYDNDDDDGGGDRFTRKVRALLRWVGSLCYDHYYHYESLYYCS